MSVDSSTSMRAPLFPEELARALAERKVQHRESVPEGTAIPAGSRQETLFSIGMALRSRGSTPETIDLTLRDENQRRCTPPLSDRRMKELLEGVMRSNKDYDFQPLSVQVAYSEVQGAVDWEVVWASDYPPVEWIPGMEGLLIKGRATNLFGQAGTGKSELVLHRAVCAAQQGARILYLDREMTEADTKDRLISMGFKPKDLSNLFYIPYPDLPMLDTPEGGRQLLDLTNSYNGDGSLLDSASKFVGGDEQDSGTWTKVFVHTMIPMRLAEKALLFVDHSGKDQSKGARGTSAKKDNIDLFMETRRRHGVGTELETKKQRHSFVQSNYVYRRSTNPISYSLRPSCTFCGAPATGKSGPAQKPVCDRCIKQGA